MKEKAGGVVQAEATATATAVGNETEEITGETAPTEIGAEMVDLPAQNETVEKAAIETAAAAAAEMETNTAATPDTNQKAKAPNVNGTLPQPKDALRPPEDASLTSQAALEKEMKERAVGEFQAEAAATATAVETEAEKAGKKGRKKKQ